MPFCIKHVKTKLSIYDTLSHYNMAPKMFFSTLFTFFYLNLVLVPALHFQISIFKVLYISSNYTDCHDMAEKKLKYNYDEQREKTVSYSYINLQKYITLNGTCTTVPIVMQENSDSN